MNLNVRLLNLKKLYGPKSSLKVTNNQDHVRMTASVYAKEDLVEYSVSIPYQTNTAFMESLLDQAFDNCMMKLGNKLAINEGS